MLPPKAALNFRHIPPLTHAFPLRHFIPFAAEQTRQATWTRSSFFFSPFPTIAADSQRSAHPPEATVPSPTIRSSAASTKKERESRSPRQRQSAPEHHPWPRLQAEVAPRSDRRDEYVSISVHSQTFAVSCLSHAITTHTTPRCHCCHRHCCCLLDASSTPQLLTWLAHRASTAPT